MRLPSFDGSGISNDDKLWAIIPPDKDGTERRLHGKIKFWLC